LLGDGLSQIFGCFGLSSASGAFGGAAQVEVKRAEEGAVAAVGKRGYDEAA